MLRCWDIARLSESYERKAARSREQKRVQTQEIRSRFDFESHVEKRRMLGRAMLAPLRMLFLSKTVLLTSVLAAVGYGWMYILHTILPAIFLVTYVWEPENMDLAYLGTAVGALVSTVAATKISDSVMNRRKGEGMKTGCCRCVSSNRWSVWDSYSTHRKRRLTCIGCCQCSRSVSLELVQWA